MALTRRELNERGEHLSLGSIVNTVVFGMALSVFGKSGRGLSV